MQNPIHYYRRRSRNSLLLPGSLLLINHLSESQWRDLVALPISFGGFGLQFVSSIADAAFMAAWSRSVEELPIRFPAIWSSGQSPVDVPFIRYDFSLSIARFYYFLEVQLRKLPYNISKICFHQN